MSRGAPPPGDVREMFDRLARVYDRMNLVISGFQEPRWRSRTVREAGIGAGDAVLEVACGTGKLTLDLWRAVRPGGRAVGLDASGGMLEVARRRGRGREGLRFVLGDALDLPFEADAFDAAAIAFGMRNLSDHARAFRELARVVHPGGRIVCLEIARPTSRPGRLIAVWFDRLVPQLGRLVGHGADYAYLVRSTKAYPAPDEVAAIMRRAGIRDVEWCGLSAGIVTLHVGRSPDR